MTNFTWFIKFYSCKINACFNYSKTLKKDKRVEAWLSAFLLNPHRGKGPRVVFLMTDDGFVFGFLALTSSAVRMLLSKSISEGRKYKIKCWWNWPLGITRHEGVRGNPRYYTLESFRQWYHSPPWHVDRWLKWRQAQASLHKTSSKIWPNRVAKSRKRAKFSHKQFQKSPNFHELYFLNIYQYSVYRLIGSP